MSQPGPRRGYRELFKLVSKERKHIKRRAKFTQGSSSFFVVLRSSFGVLRVVLARRVRLGLDRVYGSSEDCCLTITLPSLLAAGLA